VLEMVGSPNAPQAFLPGSYACKDAALQM